MWYTILNKTLCLIFQQDADFTHNKETACLACEAPTSPTKAIREALTMMHIQTP